MRRREFFTSLFAPLFLLTGTRYGYLDVDTALARGFLPARIWLNGVEVDDVTVCDDVKGYIVQFVKDENGHYKLNEGHDAPITRTSYGVVRYVPCGNARPGKWGTHE